MKKCPGGREVSNTVTKRRGHMDVGDMRSYWPFLGLIMLQKQMPPNTLVGYHHQGLLVTHISAALVHTFISGPKLSCGRRKSDCESTPWRSQVSAHIAPTPVTGQSQWDGQAWCQWGRKDDPPVGSGLYFARMRSVMREEVWLLLSLLRWLFCFVSRNLTKVWKLVKLFSWGSEWVWKRRGWWNEMPGSRLGNRS